MKAIQRITASLAALTSAGVLGMNLWFSSAYDKGAALPECFAGVTIIATALVLLTAVTTFLGKRSAGR